MNGFVWLDRVKSDEEINQLRDKALLEHHDVFFPTHIAKKDKEIVGYFSIGTPGVPLVPCWFGQKLSPRESFTLINMVENLTNLNGAVAVTFPVPKSSPFHGLMESMGYRSVGEYEIFVKKL